MKTILGIILLLFPYVDSYSQTAADIIDQHIQAIGGAENWSGVTSVRLTGQTAQMGMNVAITQTIVNGKGARTDIYGDGQTGFIIVTPVKGWMFFPFGGFMQTPREMPADQLAATRGQLNLRANMLAGKELIASAELTGTDSVNHISCYQLKIKRTDGVQQTVLIDKHTGYILRSSTIDQFAGKTSEVVVYFSQYQRKGNIVLPMAVSTAQGEVLFTNAEVNPVTDDSLLSPQVNKQ
jgi:hypothetical protein